MYDLDGNNFLTREEIVHLMRTLNLSNKRPLVSNDIEKKTDDFVKNADLDLDRKISLKEFQSYTAKNREVFTIFDNYSVLLNNNPMAGAISSMNKKNKSNANRGDEDLEHDEEDFNDDGENINFHQDELGQGDEMDPDLFNELNKDRLSNDRTEQQNLIKQGVEFKASDHDKNKPEGMFVEEEEIQGDQFGALKPWVTNLVHTVPSSYKPSSQDGAQPDAHMELEFVHGYRCHDTRSNIRYTIEGNIAYHTAAVGIVYNKDTHTQKFYLDHIDDITAFAIHPNKRYVATGEIGPYPLVSVWDTTTMTPIAKFNGPLLKGINHLAFSKDGKYLVATAADDDHGVAIFEWEKGNAPDLSNVSKKQKAQMTTNPVVATGNGGRANILGVVFNNQSDTVALTCVKEVAFVSFAGGKFVRKKATGLRGDDLTSIMCAVYVNNTLVCGSFKGNLLTFAGSTFSKSIKAHTSCVNCITLRENNTGFITGGNDGQILIFDNKFIITRKISIDDPKIASLSPRVRSVCEDENGTLLVGTRGGDIIEITGQNPDVIMRGHFDLELWGLCVHPKKEKYYTAGQDKMLAIWDVETRKIEKFTSLVEAAELISISSDGRDLAIGCKTGNLHIYDAISLEKKVSKSERKGQPVSIIKYSPDGKYLAVGGVDAMIFIYDAKKLTRLKRLLGHTSRVTHMDWSSDSEILQSNSTSYELLYHSVSSGTQITKISSMKDTDWFTWTCVLGWPVQGIWPPCASGDDINAVDRDKRGKVILTADDFGKVKLFKYPSPIDKASFKPYVGHSSHVTCVRFSMSNSHVLSTGGNDKAIFQWKFTYEDDAEKEAYKYENINEEDHSPNDDNGLYFKSEEMEGTEFGAVKPWIGEVKASTPRDFQLTKNSHMAPSQNLKKLRYVFGYRAFDTRMNVKYTSDPNKIVYHTAALGIVLDKSTNTQTYFTHHEEDIVSLAIHPNKRIVATGQMAKTGKASMIDLYIWDMTKLPAETNCEYSEKAPKLGPDVINLKGCHLRAIRILCFSPDGVKLLSCGQDDDNSVAVHDWAKSQLIVKSPVDKAKVLDAVWLNNDEFVTVGPKHIKFFALKGRTINGKRGVFGKIPVEPLVCAAVCFENKALVTGTSKGNLIVWTGGNATLVKELCKGPVYCLYAKNNLLYAGGFDGVIRIFTNSKLLEKVDAKIDITQMTRCDPGIRSIDINDKNLILIGTKGGDIVEIANKSSKILMQSHSEEELWGVAVNPINPFLVASGGGDKTLRIWDIKINKQVKFWMCDQDFRAMDWSADGKFIVIGSMHGKIYCISVEGDKCVLKGEPYQSIFKGDKQWIQELKISPNNKYVAYGSHCGIGPTFSKVEVLNVTNNAKCPFSQYGLIDAKMTSALTHLDWDVNSENIVCNSLAFELKFLSVVAKKRIDSSASRDIDWNTWTCLFGFPVQGIWPPACTGYIVNYTCKNNANTVIATSDDYSLVKLFRYPCVVEKANYKAYKGHSSHICKIRFSAKDMFLVSVGGNDKSVFIWETDFGMMGVDEDFEEQDEDNDNDNGDNNDNEEMDEENQNEDNEELDNIDENDEDVHNNEELDQQEEEIEEEAEEEIEEIEPPKKTNSKQTNKNIKQQPSSNNIKGAEKNQSSNNKSASNIGKTDVGNSKNLNVKNQSQNSQQTKSSVAASSQKVAPVIKKSKQTNKMMVFEDEEFQGDEAGVPGSTEQWRSQIVTPDKTNILPNDLKLAPKSKLQLDYVFGYRTKDTRNNLCYLKNNLVVYHASAVGIIHNLETNTQKFFTGHKEDIISFAIDSSRSLIATGENTSNDGNKSTLCVWDTEAKEIVRFQGIFEKGINALSFSPSGKKLVAISMDDNHTVYLFDIIQKKLILKSVGDLNHKILDVCYKNETEFATVGIKHFKFWINRDGAFIEKEGIFGQNELNKIDNKLGLIKLSKGNFVTGSATGEVTLWKDEKIILMKKVHNKTVDCMFVKDDFIMTGGRDYTIVISDKDLTELRRIVLDPTKLNSILPIPRSLEISLDGLNKILLGTLSSEIFELVFSSDNILSGDFQVKHYLSAHYATSSTEVNEINGLVYWPGKELFITVSEDVTVRFWDVQENKQMEYFKLDIDDNGKKISNLMKASCVDIDCNELHMAIGFTDGSIRIYSIENNFEVVKVINLRNSSCTDLKYSPDNNYLAVATKDSIVDILKRSDYTKLVSLDGHTGPVTHIDWSKDSKFISSSSLTDELNFYNARNGSQVKPEDLKNEEWESWTREYGWPVQGCWSGNQKVLACDRSLKEIKSSKLIAAGYDNGSIRVFRYILYFFIF